MHMNKVIRFKVLLYGFFCVVLALSSCAEDGDIGAQGNKGEQGVDGENGDTGTDGQDGAGIVAKIGYVEGTVKGTYADGNDFSETFNYAYYDSTLQAITPSGYFYITRYELNASYDEPNIGITLELTEQDGETLAQILNLDFLFIKELSVTNVLKVEFYLYDVNSAVTNYVYDEETGIMSFDFSVSDGGDNSTGNEIIVEGTFNSGGLVYQNVIQ